MDSEMEFKVTSKAGAFVAGRRSPGAGAVIKLTEEQAFFPLRQGEIEPIAKPQGRRKTARPTDDKTAPDQRPAADSSGE